MATRKVFFSFHYTNDVTRANVVRNSWVTQGAKKAGFIDKAEFEKLKLQGSKAVKDWIDKQLHGTSVTVVLIGKETLNRPYVQYEIQKSIERGNAIIGVQVGGIKNLQEQTSYSQSKNTKIDGKYFKDMVEGFYDYIVDDGYTNLGNWVDDAAIKKGK